MSRNDGMSRREFAEVYELAIEEALDRRELQRNPIWTESIAVGSKAFISTVSKQLWNRTRLVESEVDAGIWTVREPSIPYGGSLSIAKSQESIIEPPQMSPINQLSQRALRDTASPIRPQAAATLERILGPENRV